MPSAPKSNVWSHGQPVAWATRPGGTGTERLRENVRPPSLDVKIGALAPHAPLKPSTTTERGVTGLRAAPGSLPPAPPFFRVESVFDTMGSTMLGEPAPADTGPLRDEVAVSC